MVMMYSRSILLIQGIMLAASTVVLCALECFGSLRWVHETFHQPDELCDTV
jgi:hypothetical protein